LCSVEEESVAESAANHDFLSAWLASLKEPTHDAEVVAAVRSSVANGILDEAVLRKQLDSLIKHRLSSSAE